MNDAAFAKDREGNLVITSLAQIAREGLELADELTGPTSGANARWLAAQVIAKRYSIEDREGLEEAIKQAGQDRYRRETA